MPIETGPPNAQAPLLDEVRHLLVAWQRADLAERLQQGLQQASAPAAAIEIAAYLLFPSTTDPRERLLQRLQEADTLLARARALDEPMALAAVYRVSCRLQSLLGYHLAALDHAGKAAALYTQAGDAPLALAMLVMRNDVYYQAEMYRELLDSCTALLSQLETITPAFRYRAYNGAASAHFCLALEADEDETAYADHLRQAAAIHERSLTEARHQANDSMQVNSHLNLAIVHAFLAEVDTARSHLARVDQLLQLDGLREAMASAPAAHAWRGLTEALLDCATPGRETQGWQALQAVEQGARGGGLLMPVVRMATLNAMLRWAPRLGRHAEALAVARRLLQLQRQKRHEMAEGLGLTVEAVIERPLLLQERDRLSHQGTALESALAARNAELSQALSRVQAEASIRQAAEAALQQAHDELEQQVQERGRQLEQAMRALLVHEKQRALSRMVAGMAHEMNTPLDNARMGASAIGERCEQFRGTLRSGQVRRSELDQLLESLAETSALVDRSLVRVGQLVQRFRALAGSEDDAPASQFDLVELLQLCVGSWQGALSEAGASLSLSAPPRCLVRGHPDAFRQVLQQLLENSLQHGFGDRVGGRISLRLARDAEQLSLYWQDDGVGIPPEHLPHVVEPFYTTQLGQSGVGLGLTSVHKLVVEQMHGELDILSEPGRGTEVRIHLPLVLESRRADLDAASSAQG